MGSHAASGKVASRLIVDDGVIKSARVTHLNKKDPDSQGQ